MDNIIHSSARWISSDHVRHPCGQSGAPYLRRSFDLASAPGTALCLLCTPGWHELYINNRKADDRVLAPVVTQLDQRISVVTYDITPLLHAGKNVITVLLGNGWYNPETRCAWNFQNAAWRDGLKLLCEVIVDGTTRIVSGKDWKACASPIIFNQLREGETYDARLEIPGITDPETDDSAWAQASLCHAPGGLLTHETLEPCRVTKRIPVAAEHWLSADNTVYDFGMNLTGWCEITVEGQAGAEVILQYGESVRDNFDLDTQGIDHHIETGRFQEDRYILKGGGQPETWHARFTYHGFRYVRLRRFSNPKVRILNMTACMVHNDFASCGRIETSDATLTKLQELTRRSYLCNFTGIPTDCPHREKNGWTGDAQLATETGLWNFDARQAYLHFVRMLADAQRPSGQLPGIVPTGGWGYNWGSGPAWDAMLFEGPYQIFRFYGDDSAIREHYDAMKRYLDYCQSMEDDGCALFGLGDWATWDNQRTTPAEVTSTAYYYSAAQRMACFARHLGRADDATYYDGLAAHSRAGFLRRFDNRDGTFSNGTITALGAAVYFGLAPDPALTVRKLVDLIRERNHIADFGILGAKFIPRVLADYGYADDAYRFFVQPERPGWGFWVRQGATTLWETWNGDSSRNHIMFGDVSAWMFQYPGGLVPDIEHPGFKSFRIQPCFIKAIQRFGVEYHAPQGVVRCHWHRADTGIRCEIDIPSGSQAEILLPGVHETGVSRSVAYTICEQS